MGATNFITGMGGFLQVGMDRVGLSRSQQSHDESQSLTASRTYLTHFCC